MSVVLYSFLIISGLALLFGIGLAYASRKLAVKVDQKVLDLEEALPGVNCGACGFAGCSAYANAIIFEEAPGNKCTPGGQETLDRIAAITGQSSEATDPVVAHVHCIGGRAEASRSSEYDGVLTCMSASLTSGDKDCPYGCLGYGDCTNVCEFDALHMNENGLPVVDEEKCTGCGLCAKACPRGIISMIPESAYFTIDCVSKDKGPLVKKYCTTGCIGCSICVKVNNAEGIFMQGMLPVVDYETFHGDDTGAKKCPAKCIGFNAEKFPGPVPVPEKSKTEQQDT